ncbi:MAG: HAMP domain-containing sensor histidine kinase [Pseudomonadota bacterium]
MRTLTPFESTNGSLIAAFASRLAEVSAIRRAEHAAGAAQENADASIKARSEFLANMNHELRTPLNAIIGFSTMLAEAQQYELGEEKRQSYAEYILQSADLLLGHINMLLEAAALDSGEIELSEAQLDLKDMLGEAIKRAHIVAKATEVTIDNRSGEIAPIALGDPDRFAQALDHVLRTSVRLSDKGGHILARAITTDDGWAEITVRDKSAGFAPEAIDAMLGAFSDIHEALEESFAAPGIELAIAKTFIEMQSGKFFIRSKQGEGTLVRLLLPLAETAASTDTETLDTPAKAQLAG